MYTTCLDSSLIKFEQRLIEWRISTFRSILTREKERGNTEREWFNDRIYRWYSFGITDFTSSHASRVERYPVVALVGQDKGHVLFSGRVDSPLMFSNPIYRQQKVQLLIELVSRGRRNNSFGYSKLFNSEFNKRWHYGDFLIFVFKIIFFLEQIFDRILKRT